MKKYKTKIIAVIVVLIALIGAWFLGGAPDINIPDAPTQIEAVTETLSSANTTEQNAPTQESVSSSEVSEVIENTDEVTTSYDQAGLEDSLAEHKEALPDEAQESADVLSEDDTEEDIQIFGADHPKMREPIEPEDVIVSDESFAVTLEVRVDMILLNMHLLHRDKHELVPHDGVIFPRTEVAAYAGESVFNVLQREMRRNGIHMASRFTPVFNSAYVEAINNLYEFDVGALSGWMYRVNGWFPNFGSSRYLLSPGDEIVWLYTVDLGRDLGVTWLEEGLQIDE